MNVLQSFTPPTGGDLLALEYKGRPAFVARHLGQALGYSEDGKALVSMIRRDWTEDLTEGEDFVVLRGDDLEAFRGVVGEESAPSSMARALVLLTEQGFYGCCLLTKKKPGRELRRWLRSEVMPQIARTGAFDPGKTVDDQGQVVQRLPPTDREGRLQLEQRIRVVEATLRDLRAAGAHPAVLLPYQLQLMEEATGKSTSHLARAIPDPPAHWHSPTQIATTLSTRWGVEVSPQLVGQAITALDLRKAVPGVALPKLVHAKHDARNPDGTLRHVVSWRYSTDGARSSTCGRIADKVAELLAAAGKPSRGGYAQERAA
jgi:prophage antirepressor-like protein